MLRRFLDFDGVVHAVEFVLALDDDGAGTLADDFLADEVLLETPFAVSWQLFVAHRQQLLRDYAFYRAP